MTELLPQRRDEAAESRRRIYSLAGQLNALAQRFLELRERLDEVAREIRDLVERYPDAVRAPFRYGAAAALALTLFVAGWIIDWVMLAPLADFVMNWAGVQPAIRTPLRLLVAFLWMAAGYAVGVKLGLARRNGAPIWPELAVAVPYVAAMPTIVWLVSAQAFEGPTRAILLPMSLVTSLLPITSGPFLITSVEFLTVRLQNSSLHRRERAIRAERNELCRGIVAVAHELATQTEEHHRRFGERVQPPLSEAAARIVEEISRGNQSVRLDGQPALTGGNQQAGSSPEAAGALPAADPANPSTEDANQSASGELQYLRAQLQGLADREDSELDLPREFVSRLP